MQPAQIALCASVAAVLMLAMQALSLYHVAYHQFVSELHSGDMPFASWFSLWHDEDVSQACMMMVQIVVQGLPFAYAWQELKDLFKPLGAVKADILMGADRRSKGWGIVLFDSEIDAENAIKVKQLLCMSCTALCVQACICSDYSSCSSVFVHG